MSCSRSSTLNTNSSSQHTPSSTTRHSSSTVSHPAAASGPAATSPAASPCEERRLPHLMGLGPMSARGLRGRPAGWRIPPCIGGQMWRCLLSAHRTQAAAMDLAARLGSWWTGSRAREVREAAEESGDARSRRRSPVYGQPWLRELRALSTGGYVAGALSSGGDGSSPNSNPTVIGKERGGSVARNLGAV